MANIPLPIGIGVALVDIAKGIGAAASALPANSQSFVGAVAMKSARMRIDFEMANAKTTRSATVGISTNRLIGIGAADAASVTRSASKGFIEFEVVAISQAPESARADPAKAAAIAAAKDEARADAEAKAVAKKAAIAAAKDEAREAAEAAAKARSLRAGTGTLGDKAEGPLPAAPKPVPGKGG